MEQEMPVIVSVVQSGHLTFSQGPLGAAHVSQAAARFETTPLETEAIHVRKQHLAVGEGLNVTRERHPDTCGIADRCNRSGRGPFLAGAASQFRLLALARL